MPDRGRGASGHTGSASVKQHAAPQRIQISQQPGRKIRAGNPLRQGPSKDPGGDHHTDPVRQNEIGPANSLRQSAVPAAAEKDLRVHRGDHPARSGLKKLFGEGGRLVEGQGVESDAQDRDPQICENTCPIFCRITSSAMSS